MVYLLHVQHRFHIHDMLNLIQNILSFLNEKVFQYIEMYVYLTCVDGEAVNLKCHRQ